MLLTEYKDSKKQLHSGHPAKTKKKSVRNLFYSNIYYICKGKTIKTSIL